MLQMKVMKRVTHWTQAHNNRDPESPTTTPLHLACDKYKVHKLHQGDRFCRKMGSGVNHFNIH